MSRRLMKLKNEVYDILKWVVTILLPATSAFYAALAIFWGLPKGVEVSGSLGALAVFLGALINRSTRKYNKEKPDPELGEAA
jgi:hypothetical protein